MQPPPEISAPDVFDVFLIRDLGRAFVVRRLNGKFGLPLIKHNGIDAEHSARNALDQYALIYSLGTLKGPQEVIGILDGQNATFRLYELINSLIRSSSGSRWETEIGLAPGNGFDDSVSLIRILNGGGRTSVPFKAA